MYRIKCKGPQMNPGDQPEAQLTHYLLVVRNEENCRPFNSESKAFAKSTEKTQCVLSL